MKPCKAHLGRTMQVILDLSLNNERLEVSDSISSKVACILMRLLPISALHPQSDQRRCPLTPWPAIFKSEPDP